MSDARVQFTHLISQVDFFCERVLAPQDVRDLQTITIGSNGSVLDLNAFPPSALFYLLAKTRLLCPDVRCLSFVTRPEDATDALLGCLVTEALTYSFDGSARALNVEISVGLANLACQCNHNNAKEAARAEIESLLTRLQRWNSFLQTATSGAAPPRLCFRGYAFVRTRPTSSDEAAAAVLDDARFLLDMQRKYAVETVLHLCLDHLPLRKLIHDTDEPFSPPIRDLLGGVLPGIQRLWTDTSASPRPRLYFGVSAEHMSVPTETSLPVKIDTGDKLSCALADFNASSTASVEAALAALEAAIFQRQTSV